MQAPHGTRQKTDSQVHSPRGKAWLPALAAAGIDSRAIVEEAPECQLLSDRLSLILLCLKFQEKKIY